MKDKHHFTTLEITQCTDLIRHLIENSEIIPLVRGPAGIGKSLFASRLLEDAPSNWSSCLFEANTSMSPDRLLANIARCSGWGDMRGDLMEGLINRFEMMRDEGKVPVILLDDAQLMPPSSLIVLLRLFERQHEGAPLVSVVLFADDRIDMLLATPQLQVMTPQAIQIIDLPSLSREDATHFMHFLLRTEKLPADLELDDNKLTRLYRESKGLPGPLTQAILDSISGARHKPMPNLSYRSAWLWGGALILALIGLILFFQNEINRMFEPPKTVEKLRSTASPAGNQALRWAAETALEQAASGSAEINHSGSGFDGGIPQQLDVVGSSEDPISDMGTSIPEAMDETGSWEADVSQGTQEVPSGKVPQQAQQKPAQEGLRHSPGPVDVAEMTEPLLRDVLPALHENRLMPEQVTEPASDVATTEVVAATGIEEAEAASDIAPSITRTSADVPADPLEKTDWILSRPPDHYTLQLIGVENLEALKAFVARHDLHTQAVYYTTRRKGKPWHPLLWGDFPDKKSAIEGSERLPQEVQKSGFWIRSFASVQQQIGN